MKGDTMLSKNTVRLFLKKNKKRVATGTFKKLEEKISVLLLSLIHI